MAWFPVGAKAVGKPGGKSSKAAMTSVYGAAPAGVERVCGRGSAIEGLYTIGYRIGAPSRRSGRA